MSRPAAVSVRPAYLVAAEDLRDNPGQWRVYESKGNCVVLAGAGIAAALAIPAARSPWPAMMRTPSPSIIHWCGGFNRAAARRGSPES